MITYTASTKNKVVHLRKQGLSYGEIHKRTGVSKSLLSSWLKNIRLSKTQKERLYTKQIQILSKGTQSQKERRKREVESIIQEAKKQIILPPSEQTFLLFGAAIYWGEGSKSNLLQVTNSDPRLILFMVRWIEKVFKVSRTNLHARLNIYPQQNESTIKKFWSELTGIPTKNFGKSYIKPLSTGYRKNNLYYGTIRIETPRSGNFLHTVYGWTQAILEQEDARAKNIEKRWIRLTKKVRPVNL